VWTFLAGRQAGRQAFSTVHHECLCMFGSTGTWRTHPKSLCAPTTMTRWNQQAPRCVWVGSDMMIYYHIIAGLDVQNKSMRALWGVRTSTPTIIRCVWILSRLVLVSFNRHFIKKTFSFPSDILIPQHSQVRERGFVVLSLSNFSLTFHQKHSHSQVTFWSQNIPQRERERERESYNNNNNGGNHHPNNHVKIVRILKNFNSWIQIYHES
jgi:hypothetical protein